MPEPTPDCLSPRAPARGPDAEEPEPGASRPRRASLRLALAALPAAGADLPTVSVSATISPVHVLAGLAAVAVAGFGTLALASLIGHSPTRLSQILEEQGRPERGDDVARREPEYLVVATTYIALGWTFGLWSMASAFDETLAPWALAGFVLVMLALAGSLPAAIAVARAEQTVLAVRPVLRGGWYLLRWPLVLPLLGLTRLVLHALRIGTETRPATADLQKQVMAAVADTVAEDSLAHAERTWIGNIVALKDLPVSTVMTPRPDIIAFADAMPLREAAQKAFEHGFSRYPVYHERIDVIVGIFYAKDALRLLRDDQAKLADATVHAMLREPLFVPQTTGAAQLLRRFQAGNQHMAIVIDEYGTTVGLVTVEDILEEIVGDIADEYDVPTPSGGGNHAEQIHVVEAGRVLEVPARTTVAEINERLGTSLPEEGDWETIAGLVIAKCNHIPVAGETIVFDGVEFRVLQADERRIRRLRVTSLAPQPAEGTS